MTIRKNAQPQKSSALHLKRQSRGRSDGIESRGGNSLDEVLAARRERQLALREDLAFAREQALLRREGLVLGREQAIGALESGKQLLEDGHIARLRQANEHLVVSSVQAQIMVEEIQRAKELMGHMAHYDFLTDLPNRMLLMERLTLAIANAKRHDTRLAVLFLDLDRFKVINDSLGHAVGDSVLQTVARRLLTTIRATDSASRQGGDEFVVLLTEVADERAVCEISDKMCRAISEPYQVAEQEVHIGVTIGVSMYPDDGQDATTLIRHADVAMYDAKNSGRDRYHFYRPEMNARAVERQRIEAELHSALEQKQFVLYFQPKVDLGSGAIIGSEALLRWNHPQLDMVMPSYFISVAEECGLIVPIGRWVVREACTQAKRWRDAGLHPGSVAVNISAIEFRRSDFVACLGGILADTGLDAVCLQLEITEGVLMRDPVHSAVILGKLKDMGILLAVDDFGTGYSSLSYLQQFPVDVLKIDQSFVRGIDGQGRDEAIVGAIIAMGASLGLRIIAEGVEDSTQLAFLRQHCCDEGQGYLFSRPVTGPDYARLLAGWVAAAA